MLEDESLALNGTVEEGATVEGQVELAASARIADGAVVRGPVSIAEGTTIEAGTYIGPYTSIGPRSTLEDVHIENSVVIGESTITTDGRIVDSLLGRNTTIESTDDLLPEGRRLVVGENSQLNL